MFEKIFPFRLYLHIFQLENYEISRWWRWWYKNPWKRSVEGKKKLVWTGKALTISTAAIMLGIGATVWWGWMVGIVLILQPGIALTLVATAMRPFENIYWYTKKLKTRKRIDELKKRGLKVIGITGSYGKTTVKEFLYQILATEFKVARSGENYNTVPGIVAMVDLELTERYKFFICEMGAHKRGDIRELCEIVDPDFGIVTGINEQHIERFGSIENTIKTKWELGDYILNKGGWVVANWGNKLLKNKSQTLSGVSGYGENETDSVKQNLAGATLAAGKLGVKNKEIGLIVPEHRLKVIERGDLTIIDNAYSSNPDGFIAAIEYMKKFEGMRIVITPGIVELGKYTGEVHRRLGPKLAEADYVFLVGKNERTRILEESLKKGKYEFIDRVSEWGNKLEVVKKVTGWKKIVLLFENDLTDNY